MTETVVQIVRDDGPNRRIVKEYVGPFANESDAETFIAETDLGEDGYVLPRESWPWDTTAPENYCPYPSSICRRCDQPIICIPFSDGLWVHVDKTVEWGYNNALCEDGFLFKRGVLQTAKPQKEDRLP